MIAILYIAWLVNYYTGVWDMDKLSSELLTDLQERLHYEDLPED